MTNADRLDHIDSMVTNAVLAIRAAHNRAQRVLGLPITSHQGRDPFEQAHPPVEED